MNTECSHQYVLDEEAVRHECCQRCGNVRGQAVPPVDAFGLALDLEGAAGSVESQTAERAMRAAAAGLRRLSK